MLATEVLMQEHRALELVLRILDQLCGQIEKGSTGDLENLRNILEFFQVFADKCHHGKEESLLFPALEAAGIGRKDGKIQTLLTDHEQGRGLVRAMVKSLAGLKAGRKRAAKDLAGNAKAYIDLLSRHIGKEENDLFKLADSVLPEGQQTELLKGFDRIEEEEIGSGKHEQFHRLINSLRDAYLGA